jgi:hypothetical protein
MVVHNSHTHIDPTEWRIRIDVEIGAAYLYIYPTEICSKDRYSIFTPTYTHNNLHDLVQHLKGIASRKEHWLQGVAASKVCSTCYWSEETGKYCGLGHARIGCTRHTTHP